MLLWGLGVRTLFVCCRDQTMGCHFWSERLLNRLWKSEKHLKWSKGSSDPCPNSAAISAAVKNISWQVFWDGAVVPWSNSTLCIQKNFPTPFTFAHFVSHFGALPFIFMQKKSQSGRWPKTQTPEVQRSYERICQNDDQISSITPVRWKENTQKQMMANLKFGPKGNLRPRQTRSYALIKPRSNQALFIT